ncbi:mitochondrial Rho GTPase 1-A-like [Orbicella faveolata]|uniref:mitochondrial Rho GTPase 1-A-like n=1 Tax=Orbicella faveolata TaxID=48498 RepID=UPI0009E2AC28|nr:mitochondrial Rho GTPase 1-A-like [Orbicella faveolata]
MKEVRILLVGDPQVGKTSLILSLVSEEFPEEVPTRAEEITIPADVTPEKVPTHIVDYCALEQSEDMLIDEIVKANVVCVVYDVTAEESLERITSFWLPLIRQTAEEETLKPVIIVGNKSDLMDGSTMDTVLPIMNDYTEVETCVECSAKDLKNISEMFYYAQKAVLHPTAPLFSAESKELKPLCQAALTRIFKISDTDNDGLLNDKELNEFQNRCFNTPLQGQGLQDVKNVVRKNVEGGLRDGGLTLQGFLFLHALFIQRGRHETTWTVLRKFGYGDDLKLRAEYLCPAIDMGTDQTAELSDAGYQFLIDLFNRHDKDEDEALSPEELQELFAICPTMPWGEDVLSSVETNSNGWITLQGFLAQWTLTTFLDYTRMLAYLAMFGYIHQENETPLSTAITVTRSKVVDMQKKQTSRSVFQCYVFGPPGVGKTAFLQAFLGRTQEPGEAEQELSSYAINLLEVNRQEKYLVVSDCSIFTRSKVVDMQKKQTSRSVFQCYVFGPPGVGKTAFLQAFLGRTQEPGEAEQELSSYAINLLEVNRQEKYLVLREIEWENSGLLLHDRRCDVACFIYDSTDTASFTQVIQLREKLPKTVPCMLVAGKSEGVPAKQDFEMQPSLYCTLNKLPPPQVCGFVIDTFTLQTPFSYSCGVISPRYDLKVHDIEQWASNLLPSRQFGHLCGPNADSVTSYWIVAGLVAAAIATAGVFVFRYLRKGGSTT